MNISDIYLHNLKMAEELRTLSLDSTKSKDEREEYTERAYAADQGTCNLAHCIAFFGDKNLDEIDYNEARARVKGMTCEYFYAWTLGLDYLESITSTDRITMSCENSSILSRPTGDDE